MKYFQSQRLTSCAKPSSGIEWIWKNGEAILKARLFKNYLKHVRDDKSKLSIAALSQITMNIYLFIYFLIQMTVLIHLQQFVSITKTTNKF